MRGSYSSWTQAKSGLPQGTDLGLILFIMYVNDISAVVSSTIQLYADDTKLYREIDSIPDDAYVLYTDDTKLYREIDSIPDDAYVLYADDTNSTER